MDAIPRRRVPSILPPLALALLAAALPARAQDAAEAPAARSFAFGLSADGAATRGDADGSASVLNLYPTLDATQPLPGGWRADLSLAPEAYASGAGGVAADDSYLFLSLTLTAPSGVVFGVEADGTYARDGDGLVDETAFAFVETPRLGRLAYGVLESAAVEFCVEAPGGTTNFAADDFTTFGTCEGFAQRGTLLYNTPRLAGGHILALSYTDSDDGSLEAEAAARALGAALAFEGDWRGGALEWSAGVEHALELAGEPDHGADRATFLQAGVAWTRGAVTYSLSGALQAFHGGRASDKAGAALGVDWQATERLLLSAGATAGRIGRIQNGAVFEDGEATLGLAAEYAVIPDRLRFDAGVIVVERDGDPARDTVIGLGFAWAL